MRRRVPIFLLTLLAAMVVAGCGGAPATQAEVAAPMPTQTPPAVAQTAAPSVATAEPSVSPPVATPTARAGLQASDPTAVSLAAGRPALVEFFAFW